MSFEGIPAVDKTSTKPNRSNGKMNLNTHAEGEIIYETVFKTPQSKDVDEAALEKELAEKITGEVRFDDGSKALYSTDGSNYRQIPIGVVLPKSEEDIINTIAICRKYKAPVLSRGGGTSLAGQCCSILTCPL